ncbi:MAG: antibiotic biosynthesis monooxygenase [Solirubrobacteraceae bacterium]|jgi:uncharacterized protein
MKAGIHPDPPAGQPAQATVVVGHRVRTGHEEDYRRWQDEVNRAVAGFTGFLGTEVVPPGTGQEWSVIYRFDSQADLETWLHSPERSSLIDRGADLFEGPQSQQVLMDQRREEPVTLVVSHPVDPDRVDEFRAWHRRLTDAERRFPGFRGSQMFRPVPGVQNDWTVVVRFDTDEHLNAWLESAERKALLEEGRRFQDFDLHRVASPFGSWFPVGGENAAAQAPPKWKTALSVLVGLYPSVVLLTIGVDELWKGPLWASLLVGNILSVSALTWVVMPRVTRALRFWLAPDPRAAGPRLDVLGAAVSVVFLTIIAALFWLATTQIWKLP